MNAERKNNTEYKSAAAASTCASAIATNTNDTITTPHCHNTQHYSHHVLAGALAGTTASLVTCPLDVIKTRLQSSTSSNLYRYDTTTFGAFRQLYLKEGVRGFYRGLQPNLIALAPNWGIYFFSYEYLKDFCTNELGQDQFTVHVVSAIGAGTASATITAPMWVIRTRMMIQQKGVSPFYYNSVADALKTIYKTEGVRGMYKGFTASLVGLIHAGIQFPTYELIKSYCHSMNCDHNENLATWQIIMASATSKMIASSVWYPHEVIRTRLQNQSEYEISKRKYKGFIHCVKTVLKEEGVGAFFGGLKFNLIRVVPAAVITLTSYESIISFLTKN